MNKIADHIPTKHIQLLSRCHETPRQQFNFKHAQKQKVAL